ncbi:outer mitochondrial transmembrane helix translocase-like [Paramacrobiotus metropolitanus]|uniref:outer mitochondrial transmembrane helix translocase-like n=1 Tax=Paramacrobiotus metropolitanus TaxID=2943436 RepID=UPI00244618F8|nr:outer mitochondrial transmembrane helix translocase-like [Paramacrobiotus metropolitanus]
MPVNPEFVSLSVRFALCVALSYMTWKAIREIIEPNRKQRLEAEKRARDLFVRLGLSPDIHLSEHEMFVATNLVEPSTITVDWDDIGGLESTIEELRRTVLAPLRRRADSRASSLIQPPKGVMLYGPPGCGKTMLAKALAKEADARFINLQLSTLTDKWYGESQKLAAAVFSLAEKIQPAIIFIDEIDAFLRIRDRGDHEVTAMMKAQFLSLWDGLISSSDTKIVVLGATNRPQDVDDAIRRRLPCAFCIGYPDISQRALILQKILAKEQLALDVELNVIAAQTETFSGADLHELCRKAAVRCFHRSEDMEEQNNQTHRHAGGDGDGYVINMEDFQDALLQSGSASHLRILGALADRLSGSGNIA